MKNRNFLTAILSFLTSLFMPLYEAAEKRFTLGIVARIQNGGQQSSGRTGASQDININVQTNQSVIDRSSDPIIDAVSSPSFIPDSYQQKIVNGGATSSAAVTAYFLNEDVYNVTPTNNGSGASTVTNTYNDGWTGKGYNNQCKVANQGRGVLCYGLTLVYQVTSSLAQDSVGLGTSNVNILTSSLVGASQRPDPAPLNQGTNYGQYQTGTMTVLKKFYLTAVTQVSYAVPILDTVTFIALLKAQPGQL